MGFINEAFVKQFSDNIMFAVQQKQSRLQPAVRIETLRGEEGFFDVIDAVAAATLTDDFTAGNLHPQTKFTDTPFSRRRVGVTYYAWSDLIENKDKARMLIDPTSAYVEAGAMAMRRAIDDVIIAAATGTAYTGKDGTTAVSLTNVIADDAKNLTFDKLMEAKKTIDESDVDPEEPRFIVTNANQLFYLLNDLLNSNLTRDAETVRALTQGAIDTYMGFKFIRTERLTTTTAADGTSTDDVLFAWTQPGLLLAINENPVARVVENPNYNFATQVYFSMGIGATRMDEKRVVQINCLQ